MVRSVVGLSLFAFAIRVAFVAWGANDGHSDGLVYHMLAQIVLAGKGYTNLDGSPAINWVPGWPALMAGLYALFGVTTLAPMLANAVFGAATVALLVLLGETLFGRRVGIFAGALVAVWPGLVYYAPTLHTEALFMLLFTALLLCLARSATSPGNRAGWLTGAGLALGSCALVKAEPLAFSPFIALFLWRVRASNAGFVRGCLLVFGLCLLVIGPWLVRNHAISGRLMLSANSGETVYNCNHAGSSGKPDVVVSRRFRKSCERDTFTETSLATIDRGWEEARSFVSGDPIAALYIARNKLRYTYSSDAEGERLIRFGMGEREGAAGSENGWRWKLAESTSLRLRRLANAYWFAVLALAAVGASTLRRWPRGAVLLLFGVLVTWLGIHVVFCGAPRYHVPETPTLALLAACGLERIWTSRRFGSPAAESAADSGHHA